MGREVRVLQRRGTWFWLLALLLLVPIGVGNPSCCPSGSPCPCPSKTDRGCESSFPFLCESGSLTLASGKMAVVAMLPAGADAAPAVENEDLLLDRASRTGPVRFVRPRETRASNPRGDQLLSPATHALPPPA